MKYPLSELIDRFSILMLKRHRTDYESELIAEIDRFYEAIEEFVKPENNIVVLSWVLRAYEINGKIWDLESAVRAGALDQSPYTVGERAIEIRNFNKTRIQIKNEIAEVMGEYKEIKKDHASA